MTSSVNAVLGDFGAGLSFTSILCARLSDDPDDAATIQCACTNTYEVFAASARQS